MWLQKAGELLLSGGLTLDISKRAGITDPKVRLRHQSSQGAPYPRPQAKEWAESAQRIEGSSQVPCHFLSSCPRERCFSPRATQGWVGRLRSRLQAATSANWQSQYVSSGRGWPAPVRSRELAQPSPSNFVGEKKACLLHTWQVGPETSKSQVGNRAKNIT